MCSPSTSPSPVQPPPPACPGPKCASTAILRRQGGGKSSSRKIRPQGRRRGVWARVTAATGVYLRPPPLILSLSIPSHLLSLSHRCGGAREELRIDAMRLPLFRFRRVKWSSGGSFLSQSSRGCAPPHRTKLVVSRSVRGSGDPMWGISLRRPHRRPIYITHGNRLGSASSSPTSMPSVSCSPWLKPQITLVTATS